MKQPGTLLPLADRHAPALHAPPPAHAVPSLRAVHVCQATLGSHTKHGACAFTVPAAIETPSIQQRERDGARVTPTVPFGSVASVGGAGVDGSTVELVPEQATSRTARTEAEVLVGMIPECMRGRPP